MVQRFTMLPQQYCLKWKYHNNNIQFTFSQLLEKGSFCDVTIWCGGVAFRAHRAVLASCSSLLASLLDSHDVSWGEPALVLDKTEARHLTQLLAFMYTGEVSVHHTELTGLLKTAEDLQIKGLADVSWKDPKAPKPQHTSTPLLEDPLSLGLGGYNSVGGGWPNTENAATPVSHKKPLDKEDLPTNMLGVNGSMVVPSLSLSQNAALLEAVKRKRGRPPLDPIDIEQETSPKRNKMPGLNALKKLDRSSDKEWIDTNASQKNEESEQAEELSSDYSEASLDGDISQFLDTTMEVEGSGEVHMGDMSIPGPGSLKSDPLSLNRESTSEGEKNGEKKDNPIPPQFADVVKLSDYLVRGRRPQFWAEDYVKRVMEAVFCKELEMKQAAELLGVSYGTLYGRYRDCFGCINRPYRIRDFWTEQGPAEIVNKLLKKELTLFKAAELLNVSPQTLSSYMTTLIENQGKIEKVANDGPMSPKERKSDEEDSKSLIHHKDESDVESGSEDDSPDEVPTKENTETSDISFSKTPVIRVADLKFLKGDNKDKEDNDNVARILKNNPDLTMIPTKRKTFQEEENGDTKSNSNGDTVTDTAESVS